MASRHKYELQITKNINMGLCFMRRYDPTTTPWKKEFKLYRYSKAMKNQWDRLLLERSMIRWSNWYLSGDVMKQACKYLFSKGNYFLGIDRKGQRGLVKEKERTWEEDSWNSLPGS